MPREGTLNRCIAGKPSVMSGVEDVDTPIDPSQICLLASKGSSVYPVEEARARDAVSMMKADVPKTRTDRRVPLLAKKLDERSARQFGTRCSKASNGDTRAHMSLVCAGVRDLSLSRDHMANLTVISRLMPQ